MRKFLIYLNVAFVILTINLIGYKWWHFLTEPLLAKNLSITYELKPRTSVYSFTQNLHHLGVLTTENAYLFSLFVYLHGDGHHLKAGEYCLEGGVSPKTILKKLVRGEFIQRRIIFLEGWNFVQMKHALETNPYLQHTLLPLTPEEIMVKLGHPNIPPEGQFFPDTYFFTRGAPDILVLKKAFALMQTRFARAWKHRANNLPYQTPYQALIAASIIEKESGFRPERPLIAGVLLHRLQKSMPLQIDSTVSYGSGGTVHLTKADLKQMTPYNTYLNKGWPPTPIAMPSLDAINAALHPASDKYLYFVANGHVGHYFSASLKEHDAAVIRYKARSKKLQNSIMPYLLPRLFAKSNSVFTLPLKYTFIHPPVGASYDS